MQQSPIIYLMGPTASGKTSLAVDMVQHFPCEIISVDSAMVYRGMDIGTAKPDADILKVAPHRLISIVDPKEPYSAGQFRIDALREINNVIALGKIPLLVGGTMLYFRVLQRGLARLPPANTRVRDVLQARAEHEGWEALHAELARIDPSAARHIHPHDSQRIQRALEVYQLTNKTMSVSQEESTHPLANYQFYPIAITMADRAALHARIAERFKQMLAKGFIEEVRALYERRDLSADLPSIRAVGYRQIWAYLSGQIDETMMYDQAIIATRQLAKRQLTWLRSWPEVTWFESEGALRRQAVKEYLEKVLSINMEK